LKLSLSTIYLLIIGLLLGGTVSYSITMQTVSNQISDLEHRINNMKTKFTNLNISINTLQNQLSSINNTPSQMKKQSNASQENQTEKAERFDWLTTLLYDLQLDTTDSTPKNNNSYDDEHYARDLEDNLEAIGYNASCIIAFYMANNELNWDVLVKNH